MVSLSCLAGPDRQSSSKMDVLAALDSLSTLDAIISDSRYESGSISHDEDNDDSQLPTEHYLALAESLDITQLQQKQYSPKTQEKLNETCDYWESTSRLTWSGNGSEPLIQRRWFISCIKCKSLLETFWKWWHLVLKQEIASGLNKDTIVKVEDVVAQVTTENKLTLVRQPKKNMNEFKIPEIIFDPTLVLSPHICLLTMLFHIGGFKSISTTGPVLDSAEKLYSTKVLDGKGQQPLLLKDELLDKFVFCQTELTSTGFKICLDKRMTPSMVSSWMRQAGEIMGFEEVAHPYNLRYAGAKAFNNSEEVSEALQNIMLQHADIRTFVKHYQVDVDIDAQGIVRKTGSQTELVRFACSMSASIDPNRPFKLSPEESRSLKYLPVVLGRQDTVQKRKRELDDCEAELERANKVCKTALGHLDDRVLAESNPEVLERLEVFRDRTAEAKSVYNSAVRELRNEKQRQRNRRIRENLERYKNEQPVIDLERQLAGKLVDTKVMDTFEHEAFMPLEHLMFVDCMLTLPGASLEAEYQRRINTINAGVAFCGVEEGRPSRRPAVDDDPYPPTKRQRCLVKDNTEVLLHQAMESVQAKSTAEQPQACFQPCVCFLCVGNPSCSLECRIKKYATPGSLTRHFLRRHINPSWPAAGVECNVCEGKVLPAKSALLNHAEEAHGTVVRGRAREKLALEYQQSLEN
ncbi:uncharacterized protein PADG_07401 [Paracoccidioides brasiliensis Pb18]|uniref:Uncharacterized protein n=1 Tax=Paracoccidioides brasiliensis (strain Pb18) TaxID=502780 RepID=C1GJG5_PARBD|nr:uncharacterized protein PADG_07401 [Paracoccidioides brasiliensis Pb18]EEH42581.2 hypothetical protein PADG_07401 [Paracoccidioides brasiliensis Pb18]